MSLVSYSSKGRCVPTLCFTYLYLEPKRKISKSKILLWITRIRKTIPSLLMESWSKYLTWITHHFFDPKYGIAGERRTERRWGRKNKNKKGKKERKEIKQRLCPGSRIWSVKNAIVSIYPLTLIAFFEAIRFLVN